MSATSRTQYRIHPDLKITAESILARLGIKPAQAITIFYTEIARTGTFPFTPTSVPKKELLEEFKKVEKGKGIKSYKNISDLFTSLNKL